MSFFARGFTRQNIVAIAVGVFLAGAPMVAFNFWLGSVVDKHGREEGDLSARHAITLIEQRIGAVVRTLEGLNVAGLADCGPAALEAMQRATFETPLIKEISILDVGGRIACSSQQRGAPAEREAMRRILATEPLQGQVGYSLDVVTLPGGQTMVRLRRPVGSGIHAIAALVPAGMFLPHVAVHAFDSNVYDEFSGATDSNRASSGAYAEVETPGEFVIAEVGGRPAATAVGEGYTAEHTSRKYGFKVRVMVPSALIDASGAELKWLGLFVPGLALVALGLFVGLVARRDPNNPILAMQRALAAGEFVPYYQPIVDITTGQLRGAEVLVRWKKPDGSLVPPAAFIPLAESSGMIRAMTLDLMRRVSDEAGKAIGERPGLKVSFNFASRLFGDKSVVEDVCGIFARSPIKLAQVVLEVTERDPIENFAATRQIIAALQTMGVRIAIDDVGTGHSGLSYMLKLGVDIIKIDKIFIDSIGSDRNSTTIVETLVDLANNMRMDVVAEGVENFEQVMHLREIGIRAAQGFVFAPPLPGSAFLKLVEAMDGLGDNTAAAPAVAAA